ncbi:MAG: hypothetical protein LBT04_07130 [Prevotellaceae bacterium]|nr:hypothetical protein [Prevotellaceae bacterium]
MNKYGVLLLFITLISIGCGKNKNRKVDLSGIDLDIKIARFDRDFFAVKDKDCQTGLPELFEKYPDFAPIYFGSIVQFGNNCDQICEILPRFFSDTAVNHLYTDVLEKFKDISKIEKKLTNAFARGKYFFPKLPVPQCIIHLSGFNQSVLTGDNFISVSVDNYLGENYPAYARPDFYTYQRQNMKPEKIPSDYIHAWLSTEFEYDASKEQLLDEMIYRGKLVYLTSLLLQSEPEELIVGYTKEQWQWCKRYEKDMWGSLIESKHLFSNESTLRMKYLEEAPFTQPFTQKSPGRAGVYIGWRIVESYMENNPKVTPLELVQNTDAQQILEQSGYNP